MYFFERKEWHLINKFFVFLTTKWKKCIIGWGNDMLPVNNIGLANGMLPNRRYVVNQFADAHACHDVDK